MSVAAEGLRVRILDRPTRKESRSTLSLEKPMETTGYGTSPSTPKAPGTLDSALSKASTGAHSAVNTMADAADGAIRKTKPAIDKVASMAHQAVDKAAASAAPAADWIEDKGQQLDQ